VNEYMSMANSLSSPASMGKDITPPLFQIMNKMNPGGGNLAESLAALDRLSSNMMPFQGLNFLA